MSSEELSDESARVVAAVRLLSIIDAAGKPVRRRTNNVPDSAVKVVDAELSIHALDFWVRNPDYLAYEMLNLYEATGDTSWLDLAESVMSGDEPDLRRVPMMRYLFGAYEDLSDSMSTLMAYDLVASRATPRAKTSPQMRSYYLLTQGYQKAQEIAAHGVLGWFPTRAALVVKVAGKRSGAQLKKAQHDVSKYHNAKLKELIPPIFDETEKRLKVLRAKASGA